VLACSVFPVVKILWGKRLRNLKRCGQEIQSLLKEMHGRILREYFEDQHRQLMKFVDKYIFHEQQLHEVRKHLKRYCLNLKNSPVGRFRENWRSFLNYLASGMTRKSRMITLLWLCQGMVPGSMKGWLFSLPERISCGGRMNTSVLLSVPIGICVVWYRKMAVRKRL